MLENIEMLLTVVRFLKETGMATGMVKKNDFPCPAYNAVL